MKKFRFASVLLAVLFVLSSALSAFALPAPTPEADRIPAGENGYLSLHKYVSKTDVDDVFKVQLQLKGKIIPPSIDIAIVLDHTGSMNATDIPSSSLTRWQAAVNGAKEAAKVFLDPSEHPLGAAGADKTRVAVTDFTQFSPIDQMNGSNFYTTDAVAASSGTKGLTDILGATPNIGLDWLYGRTTTNATYVATGLQSAYNILRASTADYKYVLFLGDGGDGAGSTNELQESTLRQDGIAWAKLIKGDPSINYTYATKGGWGLTNMTALEGLDAEIWVIALGSTLDDFGPTQASDMLAAPGTPWVGTSYIAGTGIMFPAGISTPINTARQSNVPEYLMTIAGKYNPTSAANTNPTIDTGWTAVSGNTYGSAIQEYRSNSTGAADIHYEHSDGTNLSALFKQYAQKMVQSISSVTVQDKLGAAFDIYQMPGKPALEAKVEGPRAATIDVGVPTISNGVIDWTIPSEIDDYHYFTLTYYVKMDTSNTDPSLYYETNEYAYATYRFDNKDYVIYFVQPYASQGGAVEVKEPAAGQETAAQEPEKTPSSLIATGSMRLMDSSPIYTAEYEGIKMRTLSSGKTQLYLSVKNAGKFVYQWQYKDADGNWVDIFGANSSVYTLGKAFKSGQEYEFRCIIRNAHGSTFYSDIIKVKLEKTSGKAALQTAKK